MRIGLIVAMEKELAQLTTLLGNKEEVERNGRRLVTGSVGGNEIVMMQCGIGKVNSAVGAVEMINGFKPELVISTGVAGGADVSMNVTDVVVSTECRYHDAYCGSECEYGQILGMPAAFASPTELVDKALSIECDNTIHAGLIVTGEWFVDSRDKMRSIMERFPAAKAVDMESCSIAQACHIYNVPFISFRIISDIPLKDEKAKMYFDFWERMANGSFEVTKRFLEIL